MTPDVVARPVLAHWKSGGLLNQRRASIDNVEDTQIWKRIVYDVNEDAVDEARHYTITILAHLQKPSFNSGIPCFYCPGLNRMQSMGYG